MSAVPPEADIKTFAVHGSFVPDSDMDGQGGPLPQVLNIAVAEDLDREHVTSE